MNGIDVSYHQGKIDWNAVKQAGIDFAILRAGYGTSAAQEDKCFDANIKGALAAGIDVGVYWFSYAVTPEDARLEARACRDVLASYWGKLTYPVYHDYEYDTERYVKEKTGRDPTHAERTAVIAAFLQEIESFGYRGGVYTNRDYMKNRLDMNALAPYELWVADYSVQQIDARAGLWQTGSTGKVSGIAGNVDINRGLLDYPALLRAAGKNGLVPAVPPAPAGPGWVSDTTSTVEIARYAVYTVKITGEDITPLPGTPGVVWPIRCRREGNATYWHIAAVGEPGSETGLYPAGGGDRIFVARVKAGES